MSATRASRRWLIALAALVAIGLVLRLAAAWDGRAPVFDAAAYAEIATNLSRGEGFSLGPSATQPASNYSPGLPLLVAAIHELSGGPDERLARLVLALVGTLAIPLTFLIGRRLAGPAAGLIGAAAVTVYPALIEYQGMLMGEPLAATLLSGAILAMLWARGPSTGRCTSAGESSRGTGASPAAARGEDHPSGGWRGLADPRPQPAGGDVGAMPRQDPPVGRWAAPGLLLGALVLVRPEYLAVSLLLALVVLGWQWRAGWARAVVAAALMLVGVAIVVAPWTVRNALVLDRLVPVSTGGGQVLFAGTYLPSDGDPERVGEEVLARNPGLRAALPADPRLEQILAALAAVRHPGVETDRALSRMGRAQLREAIAEQPLRWLGFEAQKLWNLWGHGPRAVMRAPGWALLHWALLGAALLGAVALARRRRPEVIPILVALLAVTAISEVLVASPRRALVMLPLLAALAGAGVTYGAGSLARRWRSRSDGSAA